MHRMGCLHPQLTFYVHQCAELDFGWIVMLPVNRRRPEDKIEEGTVKDLFDFVPLPSLQNEGGFVGPRPCCSGGVGRECPRGVGEANEGLLEHEAQRGRSVGESVLIALLIGQRPIKTLSFRYSRWWVVHTVQKSVYLRKNRD